MDTLAKSIVEPLARRAFRRVPAATEISALVALFNAGKSLTGTADATSAGIQIVVTTLLQSPHFLYRPELGKAQNGVIVDLTANEIASRLSYAVLNTIPGDTLINLANSGELLKPDVQKTQAERLMQDPRASSALTFIYEKSLRIDSFLTIAARDAKSLSQLEH
ncbi:MAG: DUF1595 domain-containing protein [Chitinophagaceae bacterium]|nr:DUF1595 domain-containing protein [Oligoflexus sp.]